jgi:hypothetical protein
LPFFIPHALKVGARVGAFVGAVGAVVGAYVGAIVGAVGAVVGAFVPVGARVVVFELFELFEKFPSELGARVGATEGKATSSKVAPKPPSPSSSAVMSARVIFAGITVSSMEPLGAGVGMFLSKLALFIDSKRRVLLEEPGV